MISWLRKVLFSLWILVVFGGLFLLGEAAKYFLTQGKYFTEEISDLQGMLLGVFAIFYGIYRVVGVHPLFRMSYWNWLETIPWTSREPLPLGPIDLVLQDLFILGIGALFTLRCGHSPFLFLLLLGIMGAEWFVRRRSGLA